MTRPLRVLITNLVMNGRTGTEIVTRDLALGLQRSGHDVEVYTGSEGVLALELRAAGVPVATRIRDVAIRPDVIHGHHTPVAAIAAARFPLVPAIFLAHDAVAWHDHPPRLPTFRRLLAVDETVAKRVRRHLDDDRARIDLSLNAVDLDRFRGGPPLPSRPRRALVLAKNLEHVAPIRAACRRRRIEVDVVGRAVGTVVNNLEQRYPEYDLVFASALSALEAMACGRAVIACDGRGLAGLVTPARFAAWRPLNFGIGAFAQPLNAKTLGAEIDLYDAQAAAEVARSVRAEAGLEARLDSLVRLYREVIAEGVSAEGPRELPELAMAEHLETWAPRVDQRWPWTGEREALLRRIADLEGRLTWRSTARQAWQLIKGARRRT